MDTQLLLDLIALQRSDDNYEEGDIYISSQLNYYGLSDDEDGSITINMLNETEVTILHMTAVIPDGYTPQSIVNGFRSEEMDLQYRISSDSTSVSFIIYGIANEFISIGGGSILVIGLKSNSLNRNIDSENYHSCPKRFENGVS